MEMKVRKTVVWMEWGGVLRRRVQSEGVWAGTRTGACILRCRIRVGVTEHHLRWIPTLLVLFGAHVLLELALGKEIRNTLSAPGEGMTSW